MTFKSYLKKKYLTLNKTMPYVRKTIRKRPYKRRNYRNAVRRYRRKYNTSKATGRSLMGPVVNFMPNSVLRKLTYSAEVSINCGIGGRALHTFSSNGLFDPNITGVGHQPRGFDQLMAAYLKYTVLGSKITITQTNYVANPGYVYLTHSSSTNPLSTESNDNSAFESAFLVKKPVLCADTTGGQRKFRTSGQVALKKYFKTNIMDEDDYSGDASNNPNDQGYWGLYVQNTNGNDPDTLTFSVQIEYITVFRNPQTIVKS